MGSFVGVIGVALYKEHGTGRTGSMLPLVVVGGLVNGALIETARHPPLRQLRRV